MPLPKNFLHQDFKSLKLSKTHIIIGILIGITFAFSFYTVSYLLRESIRVMSTTENHDIWLLTKTERKFYDFFYASISVIFGQSICFSYWLSKKRKAFKRHRYLRSSIMIDQSILNISFIYWFCKMAFLFAIFFGLTWWGGFYVFSFYPDYRYLFILFIVVLFLQNWVTIRHIFKNKSLKWMLMSILIVSSLSYGLSRINIVDYKAINETLSNKNIISKYNLRLPESNVYDNWLENRALVNDIHIVKEPNNTNHQKEILITENKIINLSALDTVISNWRQDLWEFDIPRMTCQLFIDTAISMNVVNKLRLKLSSLGAIKIAYAVIPINRKYDKRYYRNYAFLIRLPKTQFHRDLPPPPPPQFTQDDYDNLIMLDIPENNKFFVNGQIIPHDNLKNILKEFVRLKANYVLDLSTEEHVNFANYFFALACYKKAIEELRNEYAFSEYLMSYPDLDEERKRLVQDQYPFSLIEKIFEPPKNAKQ